MESEPKKKLRSPFKFSLTTSALTPRKSNNNNPVKLPGAKTLGPRASLEAANGPGQVTVSRTESDHKPRWSLLSTLRSHNLGSHTKSETKLSSLASPEKPSTIVQEIGGKTKDETVKWRERAIDVNDGAGSQVYDRPRSQVYHSTPLSSVLTDDIEYDSPRYRREVPEKEGNEDLENGKKTSARETPPSSPKENTRTENVVTVSKSLFLNNSEEDTLSPNRAIQDRYKMTHPADLKVTTGANTSKNTSSAVRERLHVDTTLTSVTEATGEPSSPSPIAPPRKHSGSGTPTKPKPSPSPTEAVPDLDVTLKSPTPPTRRRRLTRRISLGSKKLDDDEFIGFASLPDQVHRKAVKRGFEFSLMVVGDSGLGKSTLINSLFLTDLYKDRVLPSAQEAVERTVDIVKKQLEIEERGVKVRLSVVDTPGFNDAVKGDENWKTVVDYVDRQFEQYYQAESGVNRKNIQDTRVHCCLYFISPYGHGLKPLDVFMMKQLHNKVNIVPLIAKSDILTPKEVKRLKTRIMEEIQRHNISIYQFPECDSDEDEEFKEQDKALKQAIPFAVVGSNTVVEVAGKRIRGRMYPWGIVEVDNPKHCDFIKLRQMLISTHMQDLKEITSDIHYENYRAEHIAKEESDKSQKTRLKLKRDSMIMEDASDTENLLAQKEAEIQRMQEMLTKMQAQLQQNPRAQVNGT